MGKRKNIWSVAQSKPKKVKVEIPDDIKALLEKKGNKVVEEVLKPEYIEPIPKKLTINHLVDIYTKWYRGSFYFCAKYQCPKDSRQNTYETNFAKIEYLGDNKFKFSEMRHTGQWMGGFVCTLDKCIEFVSLSVF